MNKLIKKIHAREVFDKKGLPNIEVEVMLDDFSIGRVIAPVGSSRGSGEPADVRDGDKEYFNGMGVNKAINNVNTEIADRLIGHDATNQENIDNTLIEIDGTPNKSRLGGNAIVATSIATAKAAAKSSGVELFEYWGGGCEIPIPHVNVMYGGPVYSGVEGATDFQTYALDALYAKNYKDGFVRTLDIYKLLSEYMVKKQGYGMPRLAHLAGIPMARFNDNEEALYVLTKMVKDAGYTPGKDFGLFMDIAGTELFKNGKYHFKCDNKSLYPDEWIDRIVNLCEEYPLITTLEDALAEDDWLGWQKLTKKIGNKVQLVGDDLFVTNSKRLKKGIEMGCANSIIIKPNQVGTLTETFETIKLAKSAGYGTAISGRSGEISDPYIAHLCVGQNLGQGKIVGSTSSVENLNEILRIEDYLGNKAIYKNNSKLKT